MDSAFLLVVFAVVAFIGVLIAAMIGLFVLIVFVGVGANKSRTTGQFRAILEDWAARHGLEVVQISDAAALNHPFADRFGFGFDKRPAVVKRIELRNRSGQVRRGWAYVQSNFTPGGAANVLHLGSNGARFMANGDFLPETLEVAWD
jgi:hypothetical protein